MAILLDDDDGDFYSVTLAFRQTTGKEPSGSTVVPSLIFK
jgi:hypothetical protein